MKTRVFESNIALFLAAAIMLAPAATADVTSPSIKDRGKAYTNEKPLTDYYGTGNSGRLVEASELRLQVDDLLAAGEYEKAIPKAKKAVQLDPGDPSGHLFLAKALTNKFYQQKGEVDEKLLAECIREWEIIRFHDADPTEQWEAGNQSKQLKKIAKAMEKEKLAKEKQKLQEAEALARKQPDKASPSPNEKVAERNAPASVQSASPGVNESAADKRQIAERKKRFGIF